MWEALVPAAMGAIILAITVSALREVAAMKRWPVANGRIVSSKVEEYRESVGGGDYSGNRVRMILYRPVVLYEYEIVGKRFQGNRITQSPGLNRGVPDFAEKIVQRYASGTPVEVRYNPKRPEESVLEPRLPGSWVLALVIAIGLFALAANLYFRG
jgi:hypothetical protein